LPGNAGCQFGQGRRLVGKRQLGFTDLAESLDICLAIGPASVHADPMSGPGIVIARAGAEPFDAEPFGPAVGGAPSRLLAGEEHVSRWELAAAAEVFVVEAAIELVRHGGLRQEPVERLAGAAVDPTLACEPIEIGGVGIEDVVERLAGVLAEGESPIPGID